MNWLEWDIWLPWTNTGKWLGRKKFWIGVESARNIVPYSLILIRFERNITGYLAPHTETWQMRKPWARNVWDPQPGNGRTETRLSPFLGCWTFHTSAHRLLAGPTLEAMSHFQRQSLEHWNFVSAFSQITFPFLQTFRATNGKTDLPVLLWLKRWQNKLFKISVEHVLHKLFSCSVKLGRLFLKIPKWK